MEELVISLTVIPGYNETENSKHHRIILPISGCTGPRLVLTSNNHSYEEMDTVGSEDVAEKLGENMVREKIHIHTKI